MTCYRTLYRGPPTGLYNATTFAEFMSPAELAARLGADWREFDIDVTQPNSHTIKYQIPSLELAVMYNNIDGDVLVQLVAQNDESIKALEKAVKKEISRRTLPVSHSDGAYKQKTEG